MIGQDPFEVISIIKGQLVSSDYSDIDSYQTFQRHYTNTQMLTKFDGDWTEASKVIEQTRPNLGNFHN